jgi:hypothetical protein
MLARRVLGAFSSLAWLLASAAPAHATPPTSSLSWVRLPGAESCLSTHQLAESVEKRLGHRAFVSASQAELSLEGRIERTARDRWSATLVVSDRNGHVLGKRELHARGDSCAAIERSLVLVVAIAIDPGAVQSAVLTSDDHLSDDANNLLDQLDLPVANDADLLDKLRIPEPAAAAAPAPGSYPIPPPPSAAGKPAPASVPVKHDLLLVLSARAVFGVLPSAAVGGQLSLAYEPRTFVPFELLVFGYWPQTGPSSEDSAVPWQAHFVLYGLGGRLCPWSLGPAVLRVSLCGGAHLGVLSVDGRGFARDLNTTGPWAQLDLQARLLARFGRFALQLAATAGASLLRDQLEFADAAGVRRPLFRPDVFSLGLALGAGMFF